LNNTIATVTAPQNYHVVTGLTLNTAYSFVVRAVDSDGGMELNTTSASSTTANVTVTHNGWEKVYAVRQLKRKILFLLGTK
jgi:hypothetical protein